MKLLIVNHFPVYPPTNGGKMRIFNLALALSRHVQEVTMVCLSSFKQTRKESRIGDNILEIDIPASLTRSILLTPLYALRLNNVDSFSAFKASRAFRQLLEGHDQCLLEHPYMSPLIDRVEQVAYDAVDVDYVASRSYNEGKFMSRLVNRKVFEVESLACIKSKVVFTTNEYDRDAIDKLYGLGPKAVSLRTPIDTQRIRPNSQQGNLITFIGSDVIHNRRVLSELLKAAGELPQREFYIGGSVAEHIANPPKNVRAGSGYPYGNHEIEGVYRDTAIALSIESQHGTGTPFKSLEYMAYGLPVLMLESEANRVGYTHGQNAYVTRLETLKGDIEYLMNNEQQRREIGKAARRLVEGRNDMDSIGRRAFRAMSA